jgi:hypothetical protein
MDNLNVVFQIESCGTLLAIQDSQSEAFDFAKHYSDKGTKMSVNVYACSIVDVSRQFLASFVDGRLCDAYTPTAA